jgi:hypothetical protein
MKFNRRTVLLLLLILAIIVLFLPIKVYYSFDSAALVFPSKEWNLKRIADDSYISELVDHETNVMSNLMSYKFDRGDVAEVRIDEKLISGQYVKRYDTVAVIHSFFVENEIVSLKNLKNIEEAALKMTETGEKQTLIDQSQQRQVFAQQQLDLAEKNYIRYKKLYQDSIISLVEFELYENQYQLAKTNVQIANNELLSLESGAKNEEIEYIRRKIEGYEKEVQSLEAMKETYFINPPIDGIISFNKVAGCIISVSDTNRYILRIPVKINNIQYLNRISGIKFVVPGYTEKTEASFMGFEGNVKIDSTTSQQLIIAKALVSKGIPGIFPGMAVSCKVYCDKITIFDFLRRSIKLKF